MNHYGDNFILVMPEEQPLHTYPFCGIAPDCHCHEDQFLISVAYDQMSQGLLTPLEARRTIEGRCYE